LFDLVGAATGDENMVATFGETAAQCRAKTKLGVTVIPLQSNSVSDYLPNLTSAVRKHADLVIAAGFLLAYATATVAKKFPDTHFAITDYPVGAAPFAESQFTNSRIVGGGYGPDGSRMEPISQLVVAGR